VPQTLGAFYREQPMGAIYMVYLATSDVTAIAE